MIPAPDAGQSTAPTKPTALTDPQPTRVWASSLKRLSRIFGSLQLAIVLLAAFAGVLALGTFVESAYDSRATHQLVYETWWFVALLGLLGVNIFCAAIKKRPWRKHQTGFLITHVGLLALVFGGVMTSLAGVHGVMTLIDTDDSQFLRHGLPTSNAIFDPHRDLIRVRSSGANSSGTQASIINPGPLPWNTNELAGAQSPILAAGLNRLAHPLPRSFTMDLNPRAKLEILSYYPHAHRQPFKPTAASDPASFPALAVELGSPTTGPLFPVWLGFHGEQRSFRPGPGLIELLARRVRTEQLNEFHNPPIGEKAGKQGTLVLGMDGQTFRLDVEQVTGKGSEPLGTTGWSLAIKQYMPNFRDANSTIPTDPGLALELKRADRRFDFAVVARQAGEMFPMNKDRVPRDAVPELWTWYHPPDVRYGDPSLKAILQLAPGTDGAIHYRSFTISKTRQFHLEKIGTTSHGAGRERIWADMSWRFRVSSYLPTATTGPLFTPVARRVGQEDAETIPVIKCRLTNGSAYQDFWLAKTDDDMTPIQVGGEEFQVGFNTSQVILDFSLRLVRAEQTTDNGSGLPASQTSFVLLTDPLLKIHGEGRMITLNQPMAHRGYKFYQTGYKSLGMDAQGKPISRSVLKVQYDPGLGLKYVGSTMVALGIACMFYMRAYFFKRPER